MIDGEVWVFSIEESEVGENSPISMPFKDFFFFAIE